MATKTKTSKPARGTAAEAGSAEVAGERRMVALGEIEPNPWQTRTEFAIELIGDLAASIREHGLLQPPIVREKPGFRSRLAKTHYQLVAGERRFRACKLLELQEIPVDVRQLDDRQVRELTIVENLKRRDLDAIAEARGFRQMVDAGDVPGPTELARRLGLSQGHVSNRLRLLELPEFVQNKVISREIPPTHARALVALKDQPRLIKEAIDLSARRNPKGEMGTVADFEEEIHWAVDRGSKPMEGKEWSSKLGARVDIFKPTEEERRQLKIIEIEQDGQRIKRALNAKLWQKLQQKHEAALARKRDQAQQKRSAGSKAKKAAGKNGKPKKLTAAEKKRLEADARRKAADQARVYRIRLWNWYVDWLRWEIAAELQSDAATEDLLRVLLAAAYVWPLSVYRYDSERSRLANAMHQTGSRRTGLDGLTGLDDDAIGDVATKLGSWCFYNPKDGPSDLVPARDVLAFAKHLEVSPERCWLDHQAGPLSEGFWNLHTKAQLLELGRELKVDLPAGGKKAALVKAFLAKRPKETDKEVGIDLPREVKRIKRP